MKTSLKKAMDEIENGEFLAMPNAICSANPLEFLNAMCLDSLNSSSFVDLFISPNNHQLKYYSFNLIK